MQQKQENFNQRATHFILGNAGQDAASIYKKDYNKKQADHSKDYQAIDPFKGNNINPKGQSSFSTTNNALYKNWQNAQRAGLDAAKLQDLRAHHFNLGGYNVDQSATTHKLYYDRKQLTSDATKNREQSKYRMQSHYHDLKEQPYTNFKSTYNKEFNQKVGEYQGAMKPDSSKNAIVFGNNYLPMSTTNKDDYQKKHAQVNRVNTTLKQSSSLVLGNKSQPMETINQMYYDQKAITKNQLPESTMKELRATHFNLGGMPNGYATEHSQNYHKPPLSSLDNQIKLPQYETGTWNQKNAKFDSGTTNRRQLPARNVEPYTKAEPKVKGGFSLGNQGNYYNTQFSQNFVPKEPNYTGKAVKPTDNVETGFHKGTYDTQHRSSFKQRNPLDGKILIDIAAKSKQDHFKIGGNGQDPLLTVYQDQYRPDKNHTSKMFHKDNL